MNKDEAQSLAKELFERGHPEALVEQLIGVKPRDLSYYVAVNVRRVYWSRAQMLEDMLSLQVPAVEVSTGFDMSHLQKLTSEDLARVPQQEQDTNLQPDDVSVHVSSTRVEDNPLLVRREGQATLVTHLTEYMARVFEEVHAERLRQDEQWGISEHGPEAWTLIIQKHVGRIAADALEHLQMHGGGYDSEGFYAMMEWRERCVKVAALCVAACECIDRATWLNDWKFWELRNLSKEEYAALVRSREVPVGDDQT